MEIIETDKIADSTGAVGAIAVASTGNIYTHSHKMKYGANFTLSYKATVTSGTPDVDLYLQQSFGPPTTEGLVGDAVDGWVTVGNKIADITDELWHHIVISPCALPFLRFYADGQGANPATCTLDLRLSKQEVFD